MGLGKPAFIQRYVSVLNENLAESEICLGPLGFRYKPVLLCVCVCTNVCAYCMLFRIAAWINKIKTKLHPKFPLLTKRS
jgi:hypothetical protein